MLLDTLRGVLDSYVKKPSSATTPSDARLDVHPPDMGLVEFLRVHIEVESRHPDQDSFEEQAEDGVAVILAEHLLEDLSRVESIIID